MYLTSPIRIFLKNHFLDKNLFINSILMTKTMTYNFMKNKDQNIYEDFIIEDDIIEEEFITQDDELAIMESLANTRESDIEKLPDEDPLKDSYRIIKLADRTQLERLENDSSLSIRDINAIKDGAIKRISLERGQLNPIWWPNIIPTYINIQINNNK